MRPISFLPILLIWTLLPGCGKKAAEGPPNMPPAHVTFVPAREETVTITADLPGRISAVRVAEIRARVSGILLKKTFTEGADVSAGDVLFEIDPAPLKAAKDSAAANLSRAEATLRQASLQFHRLRELAKVNAVSKQDADNAESAEAVSAAEVLAAKAALAAAELNLSYSSVTAPISGRIGKALVTEGALVGQGDATRLAVIQQLDPIYCDFTQPGDKLTALKNAAEKSTDATLLLSDNSSYPHPGKILFSEAFVDESSGMIALRAQFANPNRDLLPGMFVRVRVVQVVHENAVTLPQRTVTRAAGGAGSVMVIDDQNRAQIRMVRTGEITGDKWVITSGLKAGERVIYEGHLKVMPGVPVISEPYIPEADQAMVPQSQNR